MMRYSPEQIECDLRIAKKSTYWSCGCGFGHVPGCKVGRTNWIIILAAIGSIAYWWWK